MCFVLLCRYEEEDRDIAQMLQEKGTFPLFFFFTLCVCVCVCVPAVKLSMGENYSGRLCAFTLYRRICVRHQPCEVHERSFKTSGVSVVVEIQGSVAIIYSIPIDKSRCVMLRTCSPPLMCM